MWGCLTWKSAGKRNTYTYLNLYWRGKATITMTFLVAMVTVGCTATLQMENFDDFSWLSALSDPLHELYFKNGMSLVTLIYKYQFSE